MAIKTKPPKAGKQGLWNKVVLAMLSGEPVTPDQLKEFFRNDDKISYFIPNRLSTIAWQIKTFEGGVIRVVKNGKKVVSYQLMNAKDFDSNGFGPNRQAPVVSATTPSVVTSVSADVETNTPTETTTV
jgi:hypothetical protein